MKRYLTTAMVHGSFDFFSNIIVLNNYASQHKTLIERVLANGPPACGQDAIDGREIKSLVVHEVTHFLDLTTTLWGAEYITRKMLLVEELQRGTGHSAPLDVFMLNSAEVEMHRGLVVSVPGMRLSACTSLKHRLVYNDRYGPLIMICFMEKNTPIHQVPLSMLSVLEANALANEFLSKLADIEALEDDGERAVAKGIVQREVDDLLDDPELSEYTLILKLAKIHFEDLPLRELLVFVSSLARFALDASLTVMAALSNVIARSFVDHRIGESICMDMQRGMSRHVVVFKTLLLMHNWMRQIEEVERRSHNELLKTDPMAAILAFWRNNVEIVRSYGSLGDFEFRVALKKLRRCPSLRDAEIVAASAESNRSLLKVNHPGLLKMADMKLMDILLSDDSEVAMPNRIDINVLSYFDDHLDLYAKLDKAYHGKTVSKFHLPPGTPRFHIIDLGDLDAE